MNKKQLIVVWMVCFLVAPFIVSTYANESKTEDGEEQNIRTKCVAIDSVKSYKKFEKDLEPEIRWLEGGSLVGYFEGNDLRKIVAIRYGEMGKTVEECYFWEGNLIFIFVQYKAYSTPRHGFLQVGFKNPINDEIGEIREYRLYFKDNKLIRRIDKLINGQGSREEDMRKDDPGYKEAEKDFIKDTQDFVKMLEE